MGTTPLGLPVEPGVDESYTIVNSPPVNTVPGAQTTNEDTPLPLVGLSVADADGGILSTTVSVTNGLLSGTHLGNPFNLAAVTLVGSIAQINGALATLVYAPNTNFHGSDTLTISTNDDSDQNDVDTVAITVAPVADPLTVLDDTYDVNEDQVLTVPSATGLISNDSNPNGAPVVTNLVSDTSNGVLVLSGDGTFTYTPALNFHGTDSFRYVLREPGHPALASNAATVTITVKPANDPPSVTLGANQVVNSNAGAQSVASFATPDMGPDDEDAKQVVLDYFVSNDNNGLFSGQPDIANDGTLTYTPASDVNGIATVSVQVQDNGGTANGGNDTSSIVSFTITVNDKDAPIVTSFTRQDPLTAITNADTLVFRATFSEAVTNVGPDDFAVAGGSMAIVSNVAQVDPSTYDVTVSGGDLANYNGTVNLDLVGSPTITDLAGNALSAAEPGVDESYTLVHLLVTLSSSIGGDVNCPGEGDFWEDDGSTLLIKAQASDPLFEFSHFSGSVYASQNPYLLTVEHDHDIRAIFKSLLDILYVDVNIPEGQYENGSMDYPFDSIQEAVEVAREGTTILIYPGTYAENLDLSNTSLTLAGVDINDGIDWTFPVIQSADDQPVITVRHSVDPNTLLQGLVITGGNGRLAGGIACYEAQLTLANCLIVGNRSNSDHILGQGGALWAYESQVNLLNCTLSANYGGQSGAALFADSNSVVTVSDSILWDNVPDEILYDETSEVNVQYSDVSGFTTGLGNFSEDPQFVSPGQWEHASNPGMVVDPGHFYATWIMGDYHLSITSPCIDAGDPNVVFSLEPEPNGARINMGAYGNTPQATVTPIP